MKRFALVAIAVTGLAACDTNSMPPLEPQIEAPAFSAAVLGVQHFQTSFQATAMCGEPIGNIRFFGTIVGIDHTTVDGNGEVHRTRQFRVKGMEGLNLKDGTEYRVIGGAEMLTWNSQIGQVPGNAAKSIHAGTLVFDPVSGGSKVVAHHAIRYVENASGDVVLNFSAWTCQS